MKILSLSAYDLEKNKNKLIYPVISNYFNRSFPHNIFNKQTTELLKEALKTDFSSQPNAIVSLSIGEKFYYLQKNDTQVYIVEVDEVQGINHILYIFQKIHLFLAKKHLPLQDFINGVETFLSYQTKINKIRREVGEVRDIMLNNIDLLIAREAKLDELQQKTKDLSDMTTKFKANAIKKKNQHQFLSKIKNCRLFKCIKKSLSNDAIYPEDIENQLKDRPNH